MTSPSPITFTEVLKLAKQVAMERARTTINMDTVRLALELYFDTEKLDPNLIETLGIKNPAPPKRDNGRESLGKYNATERIDLHKDVIELRKKFGNDPLPGLMLPEETSEPASPPEDAPPETPKTQEAPKGPIATLRDLLLLAKWQAHQQGANAISVLNLEEALGFFTDYFADRDEGVVVVETFSLPRLAGDGAAILAKAKALEGRIEFADDLKDLRKQLESKVGGSPPLKAQPKVTHQPEPVAVKASTQTLNSLFQALESKVLGQAVALNQLRIALHERNLKLKAPGRPQTMVWAGYPGSGKTLLANTLIANQAYPGMVINMQEYDSYNESFGLVGLRRGYSDATPGILTSFVRKNPQSCIVFDNVGQAHPNVQNILGSLLSNGYLDDAHGFGKEENRDDPATYRVSFEDTLLVFIVGLDDRLLANEHFSDCTRSAPDKAIALIAESLNEVAPAASSTESGGAHTLTPALARTLAASRILPFAPLGMEALVSIATRTLQSFKERIEARNVSLTFDSLDQLATIVTLGYAPDISATEVTEQAYQWLADAYFTSEAGSEQTLPASITVTMGADAAAFIESAIAEHGGIDPLARAMFRRRQTLQRIVTSALDNKHLTLTITSCQFEQVKGEGNFGGDAGFTVEQPSICFSDIKGHTHIKARLAQILALLNQEGPQSKLAPRGAFLYGQPGTGKTMLVKALAGEANLPFIAVNAAQLLDSTLTRTIFTRARRFAPSIVFIDEIDALGVRGKGGADHSINQLLSEIDGFSNTAGQRLFVIAATNFPQKVDPAILRSGRLDLHFEVPLLDKEARRFFIEKWQDNLHMPPAASPEAWNIDAIASLTAGMSGADLEKVQRELMLANATQPNTPISHKQLLDQINTIKHGERRKLPPLRELLERTAYHEAGHAVIAHILNPDVPIEQVTIVGRGNSLGFVSFDRESHHSRPLNRQEVFDLLCIDFAGRIAQSKQFPAQSNTNTTGGNDDGASSDLAHATSLAWRAITEWGLDDEFGWLSLNGLDEATAAPLHTKALQRVEAMLNEVRTTTSTLVDTHWHSIDQLAQQLLEEETISGADLVTLLFAGEATHG